MRRTIGTLFALLLWATPALVQARYYGLDDGYDYSVNTSDTNTITITGYVGPAGAVAIPTNINGLTVTSIGGGGTNEVFAGTGATVVVIPGSVLSIGAEAFAGCASLISVITPGSVTNLGEEAFADCASLTSVYFNGDVPVADATAFNSDNNATVYHLAGITGWRDTFAGLPAASSTAQDQFSYTTNAGAITITGFTGEGVVIIPDVINGLPVTDIETNTSYEGTHNTSLTIPASVTSIGEEAFVQWSYLTSVSIPGSLTYIGDDAFELAAMTSVKIGNGVIVIGNAAFQDCYNLTNVTVPGSVTSIGDNAFGGCQNLVSISLSDNVTNIGAGAFGNAGLTSVTIPGSVTSIGNGAFEDCLKLASVTIEEGVTSIGNYAFAGAGEGAGSGKGAGVTIPSSVTNIGNGAFEGCQFLGSVVIPFGVTSIGDDAFSGSNLRGSLTIPGSVTNIGASAFADTSLTSVTIPGGVSSIGEGAFNDCTHLTSVFFAGNAPAADSTVFAGSVNGSTAYYLPGTTGWSDFSTNTGLPSVLWNPLLGADGANFGVQNHRFGFTITNGSSTKITIVVEACTNLASPVWVPLQTLTLSNSFYFSDPQWTNYSARFYGLGFP